MYNEVLDRNAQMLRYYEPRSYVVCGEYFHPLCFASWCPALARFIFWIRDLLTSGQETKKVVEFTLSMLKAMKAELQKSPPRFVVNMDLRIGQYPETALSFTYYDFASIVVASYPEESRLCYKAQKIQQIFDSLTIFTCYLPMTKEYIISKALRGDREDGPSLTEQELQACQQEYTSLG